MPRFCPDHGQLFRNRIKEGLSTIRKEYLDGTNRGCKNGPGPGMSERPYYHDFAWAYDLLQTDPIAPRVDFIEGVLRAQGIHADSAILDGGCGTGRYTIELARRGYHVYGVDRSKELLAVAKDRALHTAVHVEFLVADLLVVAFTRQFEAVLCRGVLNDLVEESDRAAVFRQFAAWLRPGGIVIFDVREWPRTVVRYKKNSVHRRTVELPDGRLKFQSETTLDLESRRMRIRERFTVSRNNRKTSKANDFVMQCWTLEEIRERLVTAGFDEMGVYPSYGEDDRAWSDRLVLVACRQSV